MPTGVYKRELKTIEERFWPKVEKTNSCWLWAGSSVKSNLQEHFRYGNFRVGKMTKYAHRVSWELHNGSIPEGMCILHKCDNPLCVNPKHLFLGTHADNMKDMSTKGRGGVQDQVGEKNHYAKLTWETVREIRRRYATGEEFQKDIAKDYNIERSLISMIVNYKVWKEKAA